MSDHSGRLVVLGASGFVGSYVANFAAEEGWQVVRLSSKDLDLTSPESPRRIPSVVRDGDTIVHSAAIVPSHKAEEVIANLIMTQNLVQGLSGIKIAQFITVSSDAVYGEGSGVINESSPCTPSSLYSAMCLTRELVCAAVGTSALTVVRPTAIYGIGDTHNSYGPNRFAREVMDSGQITIFGTGQASRDHVSIADVARIIVTSANMRQSGVINIASGRSLPFAEVAEMIRAVGPDGAIVVNAGIESEPTFRSFDLAQLVRRFPDFVPIGPEEGFERMVATLNRSPQT
jgi:UDP-glucose 4-epimerase